MKTLIAGTAALIAGGVVTNIFKDAYIGSLIFLGVYGTVINRFPTTTKET